MYICYGKGTEPKFTMFCALSQNFYTFFEKSYKYVEANCLRNSKMALKFQ